ncbi:hypothetical protein [Candidatus Rhodobacter oscarellae]|nr:hypothetical protein [Candidatus Rhodobacter lobularis]
MRALLLLLTLSLPAAADERAALYGIWGTPKQCAGEMLKEGGTVPAQPFEIRPGWLRHGQLWCRLIWFPVEKRENGIFTGARALCGEDALRGYRLGFALADDALKIRWTFRVVNGPLRRCPIS